MAHFRHFSFSGPAHHDAATPPPAPTDPLAAPPPASRRSHHARNRSAPAPAPPHARKPSLAQHARKFSVALGQTFRRRRSQEPFPEQAVRLVCLAYLQTAHFPPSPVPAPIAAPGAAGAAAAGGDPLAFALLVATILLRMQGVEPHDVAAFLVAHAEAFPPAMRARFGGGWELEACLKGARKEGHWAVREAEEGWGREEGLRDKVRDCFWGWWGEEQEVEDERRGSYCEL